MWCKKVVTFYVLSLKFSSMLKLKQINIVSLNIVICRKMFVHSSSNVAGVFIITVRNKISYLKNSSLSERRIYIKVI